jgi:hypothetical protein
MVKGLTRFVEHFAGFENAYILIGGAACDLWLSDRSLPFRATKDLDLVLVVEALDPAFFERFWAFIQDGWYRSHQRSESRPSFYRFKDPETAGYPYMIELLSRNHLALPPDAHITPIPADDDISSLSAILLDDTYYPERPPLISDPLSEALLFYRQLSPSSTTVGGCTGKNQLQEYHNSRDQ